MNGPKKRVLFLFPYSYWKANPNCVSLVERCQRDGLDFDLICPSPSDCLGETSAIAEWVWNVRRIYFSAFKQALKRPWTIGKIIESLKSFEQLKTRIFQDRYSGVITCDATGLGLLGRFLGSKNIPVIYLSFHILFRSDIRTKNEKKLAERENQFVSRVSLFLSQDENRKKLISKELGIKKELIFCSAVAPEMRGLSKAASISKGTSKKQLLYCGNLDNWNLEPHLEVVISNLPSNYYLRVHTHFKPNRKLKKRIDRLAEEGQLIFSQSFLDEEGLIRLIEEADVGLAPYFPKPDSYMVNQTLFHIGKASTKIAYYALCRKPIITSPLPSLNEALNQYSFGKAILNWQELAQALQEIDKRYDFFSNEAFRYYENELCPTEPLNLFWREIQRCINTHIPAPFKRTF